MSPEEGHPSAPAGRTSTCTSSTCNTCGAVDTQACSPGVCTGPATPDGTDVRTCTTPAVQTLTPRGANPDAQASHNLCPEGLASVCASPTPGVDWPTDARLHAPSLQGAPCAAGQPPQSLTPTSAHLLPGPSPKPLPEPAGHGSHGCCPHLSQPQAQSSPPQGAPCPTPPPQGGPLPNWRLFTVSDALPAGMQACRWRLMDYRCERQLYKGYASSVYQVRAGEARAVKAAGTRAAKAGGAVRAGETRAQDSQAGQGQGQGALQRAA